MQERSAGIVIVHNNKYLLLHYAAGHWDLPKGNIEKGESEKQTALRELEEETEIKDSEIIPDFEEKIQYFFKREGETVKKEVIFFLGKTNTNNIKLSVEHQGFKWLSFKEAIEQLTYQNAKEVLRKADAFLNNEKP